MQSGAHSYSFLFHFASFATTTISDSFNSIASVGVFFFFSFLFSKVPANERPKKKVLILHKDYMLNRLNRLNILSFPLSASRTPHTHTQHIFFSFRVFGSFVKRSTRNDAAGDTETIIYVAVFFSFSFFYVVSLSLSRLVRLFAPCTMYDVYVASRISNRVPM